MRALLYRPSWQSLRVSFLKDNRIDGGWTTPEGTTANIMALDDYVVGVDVRSLELEAASMGYQAKHEECARLYRAINCLNAVRMGNSGQGTKGTEQDIEVLRYRDSLQRRQPVTYHEYLTYAAVRWDWRVVKRELQAEYDKGDMHGNFDMIELDLRRRRERTREMRKRPELNTFMSLMKEVRNGE